MRKSGESHSSGSWTSVSSTLATTVSLVPLRLDDESQIRLQCSDYDALTRRDRGVAARLPELPDHAHLTGRVERSGRDRGLADQGLRTDHWAAPSRPPTEEPHLEALEDRRADHEHDVPGRGHQEDRRQNGENEQHVRELDDD